MHSLTSATILALAAYATAQAPCVESNYGQNLALGDDAIAVNLPLGFSFPFLGQQITAIDVSSNGQIYLNTGQLTDSRCCNGDVSRFLGDPTASICAMYMDMNPAASASLGGVFFATFPGRAVVTWDRVVEYGQTIPMTYQVQLLADGSIVVAYDSFVGATTHRPLIGLTPGNGAPDPGETNFRGRLPFSTNTEPTVYEQFDVASSTDGFDLANRNLVFAPNGSGGWNVLDRPNCRFAAIELYGQGCPREPVVYELFPPATIDLSNLDFVFRDNGFGGWHVMRCTSNCFEPRYSNNVNLGDDSLAVGLPLGFTFALPGSSSTTAIDVCSNGYIWLVSGQSTTIDVSPTVAEFLAQPVRFSPLWMDLDPSAGGAVYFDTFPNKAVITWDQVPAYGQTVPMTFQVQMFTNGDLVVAYRTVDNAARATLVGYSPGQVMSDPGGVDFTADIPFSTGPAGLPLTLTSPVLPVIGGSFVLDLTNIPMNASLGLINYGFLEQHLALASIGMPTCFLLASPDIPIQVTIRAGAAQSTIPVPSNASIVGAEMFCQGVVVAPAVNPLGVIASNGVHAVFGF